MRIHAVLWALTALYSVTGFAAATAPVPIFGLPVGGKINPPLRQCAAVKSGAEVGALCWSRKPMSLSDGGKAGDVEIPGSDSRVKWAANADFQVTITKNGTLETLQANTRSESDFDAIVASLGTRFATPALSQSSQARSARWVRPDIYIEVSCGSGICYARFESADSYRESQRRLRELDRKDSARSASP